VSKREQEGLRDRRITEDWSKISRSEGVREGGFEPPRPFGHRILRLLQPGTDSGPTSHAVSSGVVLCHSVSFRREQGVSKRIPRGPPFLDGSTGSRTRRQTRGAPPRPEDVASPSYRSGGRSSIALASSAAPARASKRGGECRAIGELYADERSQGSAFIKDVQGPLWRGSPVPGRVYGTPRRANADRSR
jgi:hypothetical protein